MSSWIDDGLEDVLRETRVHDDEPAGTGDALFSLAVDDEVRKLHIREAARQIVALEKRPPGEPFDAGTLTEILARPPEPQARISSVLPWQAAMLLVAQRKTGKTVGLLNLAWSLLTGEPFLGQFDVRPVDGTIALLNFEVNAAQIARWAADVGVPPERFLLVNLRGRRNPLGDPEDRGRLAGYLRSRDVETLLVDPFSRAYTGISQNDPGEVGTWTASLDVFARGEVGARDVILSAHAGWNGERTRGASALEDWADVVVNLTKGEDDDGARYLRAVGRDVDIDEDRLSFNPDTRRLTLTGTGSRKQAKTAQKTVSLQRSVLSVIIAQPGLNGVELAAALRVAGVAFQKGDERKAASGLVAAGSVVVRPGPRGAHCYHQAPMP